MPAVISVTDDNYSEVVEKSDKPVILAIGAPWCIDCRRIQPFFMQFAAQYEGRVQFMSCDFDANPGMKARFNVRHIPTIVYIKDNTVIDTLVEPKSVAPFKAFIEKALA